MKQESRGFSHVRFKTLYNKNRLDLSVEHFVIQPKYKELFTEEEIETCINRLKEYNYKF